MSNVEVIDLPPEGITYISGSWTANSSVRGDIAANPVYASPGTWDIGDMVPGEVVELTYVARITSLVSPGEYPELAFATGLQNPENSEAVTYSNIHIAGVSDPFVDTAVQVIEEPATVDVFTAAETVTRLPNTGPAWLDAVLVPLALASIYYMFARWRWYNQTGGRI